MRTNNIIKAIAAAFAAVVLSSCISAQRSPSQALDSFVDKAELNCESYTSSDWEKSTMQYEKLIEQYTNSDRQYTEAEKQMAARAIGRYHALLIKHGIEESASYLKELGNILPSYFDGLTKGLKESDVDFDKLLDEDKLDESLESLDNAIEKIFGIEE